MSAIHPAHSFVWPVRVYWEDTDAGDAVYHASYLRFLERARSEWLRTLGFSQQELKTTHGLALMVRDMHLDFLRVAKLDDELEVSVVVQAWRGASILFVQTVSQVHGALLLRAQVRVACVDIRRMRGMRIPAWLMAKLP